MLPPDVDERAVNTIHALCSVAGDEARVVALIQRLSQGTTLDQLRRDLSAALIVTYGRCFAAPIPTPTIPTSTTTTKENNS
ncbi:hypothetical protein [Calidifontibacter indicus]|uniref:Uncharacterized protein n=1 Tax=Calidifontibacter indicus TaxID=419650 RepID=A0A3D9URL8_9MICO|nr:hypothetical protein [Calidifontibacter indicus]REF30640.1 hypothetical protein DFJ65_1655 [Calidifontibacter indicus]